jgi:hypothetical protein
MHSISKIKDIRTDYIKADRRCKILAKMRAKKVRGGFRIDICYKYFNTQEKLLQSNFIFKTTSHP